MSSGADDPPPEAKRTASKHSDKVWITMPQSACEEFVNRNHVTKEPNPTTLTRHAKYKETCQSLGDFCLIAVTQIHNAGFPITLSEDGCGLD